MSICIYDDKTKYFKSVYHIFKKRFYYALENKEVFNVFLSGGSTPLELYDYIISKKSHHKINWNKINFFFGDERFIPHDSPNSNYGNAKKHLFDELKEYDLNLFPIKTEGNIENSAKNYEEIINQQKATKPDLVFLGMGDDGHTASLFPKSNILRSSKLVDYVKNYGNPETDRISITYNLINNANKILVFSKFKNKEKIIEHLIFNHKEKKFPVEKINKEKTEYIFLRE
ncbi:MAG: 6-phosphogluconolactonase [Thermotogota bacterium]